MIFKLCWYCFEIIRDIFDEMRNKDEAPRKETGLEENYKNDVEVRNEEEEPGKDINLENGFKLKYDNCTTVSPNTLASYLESDGLPYERANEHSSRCQKTLSNELTPKNFITDNFSSWRCGIILFVVLIVILLAILTQLDPKVKRMFKKMFSK